MRKARMNLKDLTNLRKLASSPKRLMIFLMCIGIVLFLNSFALQKDFKAKVVKVIDGDTIEVLVSNKQRHRVRFFGIDAPESNQAYGKKAREVLASMIAGKEVLIIPKDEDKYGRMIALIKFEGKDINKAMVEKGYAWAYDYYTDLYVKDQAKARENKLGLWQDKNPINPYKWRKTHSFKDDK